MLDIKNLTCGYGKVKAVDSVNLRVLEGEIVAILGSNGAGKTTLLRAVVGLKKPENGKVVFKKSVITGMSPDKIVSRGLVLVPENRQLFLSMTVRENLELGGYTINRHKAEMLMEKIFRLFPVLKERIEQPAGNLSGGEQQMLSIGRALMADPSLLILDEPSMGLAPLIVQEIYSTLEELNRTSGLTLLIVEQDASRVLKFANRIYVMETGRIVFDGPSETLVNSTVLEDAYLGRRKEN